MKRCNNCSHCVKVNQNHLYAVCDETGRPFMLWHGEDDIREYSCDKWEYFFSKENLQKHINNSFYSDENLQQLLDKAEEYLTTSP